MAYSYRQLRLAFIKWTGSGFKGGNDKGDSVSGTVSAGSDGSTMLVTFDFLHLSAASISNTQIVTASDPTAAALQAIACGEKFGQDDVKTIYFGTHS